MNRSLLGASGAIAVLAAIPTSASAAGPQISYVPRSLAQSVINQGPWTLHESADRFERDESGDHFRHGDSDEGRDHDKSNDFFKHDASGIVPPSNLSPPYSGYGSPYAGFAARPALPRSITASA